jgi:hypothetical protein
MAKEKKTARELADMLAARIGVLPKVGFPVVCMDARARRRMRSRADG